MMESRHDHANVNKGGWFDDRVPTNVYMQICIYVINV